MSTYQHLQLRERIKIEALLQANVSVSKIASIINRPRCSIYREIRRNSPINQKYQARQADNLAFSRRSSLRLKYRGFLAEFITQQLENRLSPDQIVMKFPKLSISTQGIYNFIHFDRKNGGLLWKNLRFCGKFRYFRAYRSNYGTARSRIHQQLSIDSRPSSVNNRHFYGHWEMDLIEAKGRKRPLLVIQERKSRFVKAAFIKGKWDGQVANTAASLLRGFKVKSITTDNGVEFINSEDIQNSLNTKLFYTHPYKSWQKGGIENVNKLLREFFPKGSSFSKINQNKPSFACSSINLRPRRSLNKKSPFQLLKYITT